MQQRYSKRLQFRCFVIANNKSLFFVFMFIHIREILIKEKERERERERWREKAREREFEPPGTSLASLEVTELQTLIPHPRNFIFFPRFLSF